MVNVYAAARVLGCESFYDQAGKLSGSPTENEQGDAVSEPAETFPLQPITKEQLRDQTEMA
jgi:hypothetical protein